MITFLIFTYFLINLYLAIVLYLSEQSTILGFVEILLVGIPIVIIAYLTMDK